MQYRFLTGAAAVALMAGLAAVSPVHAQTAAPADQAAPAAPAHPTWNGIMFSGHVDAGTTLNPDSPDNNVNFGQLFTDRANSFRVNQTTLAAEQDIDSTAPNFNWGWRVEGMYGTDARFTHTTGLFDRATNSPYQWDLEEASLSAHLPYLVSGGIDVKAGTYPTPIGFEVIDSTGNFFYSHSYIFNYGIPLKHTGIYATAHVFNFLDIWAGADTGVNTGVPFMRSTDDNHTGAFLAGFGLNNLLPNLTILGLAHVGAENAYVAGRVGPAVNRNNYLRQIYDVVTSYKLGDALTLANETNFIKDDLSPGLSPNHSGATAEGTAFYGIYKFNDQWSFGARGEVFRDDQGFFVTSFQESQAFMNAERGTAVANSAFGAGYNTGKATYSELTIGANWAPAIAFPAVAPATAGLTIRPEFRWDHAFGMNPGMHPFDVTNASGASGTINGTKNDQFLLSVDAILAF